MRSTCHKIAVARQWSRMVLPNQTYSGIELSYHVLILTLSSLKKGSYKEQHYVFWEEQYYNDILPKPRYIYNSFYCIVRILFGSLVMEPVFIKFQFLFIKHTIRLTMFLQGITFCVSILTSGFIKSCQPILQNNPGDITQIILYSVYQCTTMYISAFILILS